MIIDTYTTYTIYGRLKKAHRKKAHLKKVHLYLQITLNKFDNITRG